VAYPAFFVYALYLWFRERDKPAAFLFGGFLLMLIPVEALLYVGLVIQLGALFVILRRLRTQLSQRSRE
jgi:hypothetical protein